MACFFALLLSPFVGRLKKWKIPDVLGILITFFGLSLVVSLFLLSIVPVFVGLAEDSKIYIVNTVSAFEAQARANFPLLDALPFNLGSLVRNEVNIEGIR